MKNNFILILNNFFKIKKHQSSIKIELLAGITTFLTMSYIVIINPLTLSQTGMNAGSVFVATCIASAIGCFIMGLIANYPIALAPGLGLNAYFTYTVVLHMKVPWQTALAAVFCSGILFIIFSLSNIREKIINEIPKTLKYSITAGIGLFLALIACKNSGIIVANNNTFMALGDITDHKVLLSLLGLLIIITLSYYRITGAIIIGILSITFLSIMLGFSKWQGLVGKIPSISPTFFKLDFNNLLTIDLINIIFIFFIVDLFDSTGVLISVANKANLLKKDKLPNLKKTLLADSIAIPIGAILGTSSTTAYLESISGVSQGGRTGLTTIVVGILFIFILFFYPMINIIPYFAVSPALLFIGSLMMVSLKEIDWNDISEGIPAFLTLISIPFTYSIANGIAIGFISYTIIKILCNKIKDISITLIIISIIWGIKLCLY